MKQNSYAKCGDPLVSKNRKYQITSSYYPFSLHALKNSVTEDI